MNEYLYFTDIIAIVFTEIIARMISIIEYFYNATYSTTTQRRSRQQHGYCIGVSRRSAQETVSEGLAQGPYMAARVGVVPATLRSKVIDSTKAPPCLTRITNADLILTFYITSASIHH